MRGPLTLASAFSPFENNSEIMESETTLVDIPGEVLPTSLFPFLTANELLRLRRTCQWIKGLADDYLRLHPPSKSVIVFSIQASSDVTKPSSLERFLIKDRGCTIRVPVTSLELQFSSTKHFTNNHLLEEFLENYRNQIVRLEIPILVLPMRRSMFQFFERLPRLKSLTVSDVVAEVDARGDDEDKDRELRFPATFRNLKKLDLQDLQTLSIPQNYLWNLIEFCTSLESLTFPFSQETGEVDQFHKMQQVLSRKEHKNFRFYDMTCQSDLFLVSKFEELRDMVCRYDLKLIDIESEFLYFCESEQRKQLAPYVVSMQGFRGDLESQFDGVTFPNLKAIRFGWFPIHPLPEGVDELWIRENIAIPDIDDLKLTLTHQIYPALRKLEIRSEFGTAALEMFGLVWGQIPNLEEVAFQNCPATSDAVFIGPDPEQPTFLELTRLKKLELEGVQDMAKLTDAVFLQVFRHLRIQELFLQSTAPIVSVTTVGVEALLTGAFMESIKWFPFHEWSLEGMTKEELKKLSRKFPHNQEV